GFPFGGGGGQGGGFRLPIIAMGLEPGTEAVLLGGGVATMTAGRPLGLEDGEADVAILGQALANANSLQIGSTIDWEGTPVEVIGVFTSGQRFGDNMVVMPFSTAQRLLGLEGEVSQAVVNIDSAANISAVEQAIRASLGSDQADVVSDAQRIIQVTSSLESAQNTTKLGMYGGLGAGAAVIVASMLLVVRERRREIGVLKAIGASNRQVVFQFAAESLVIAVIAGAVGLLVAQGAFEPVTALTVPTTQAQVNAGGFAGFPGPGRGGGAGLRALVGGGGGQSFGVGTIEAGLSLSSGLFIAGSGIVMALFAALASVWSIARVKPAEVLRSE
ncbi:MAG: FtsX-like permease family protein, partial [Chloroflexi bacterium]|nr:FtsX-like permease family protein [Chloroflexota bacterium]